MSERVYTRGQRYSTKGLAVLDFEFNVGASGTPSMLRTSGSNLGFYGISRSATGRYALYLTSTNSSRFDKYLRFVFATAALDYDGTTVVLPSIQFDLVNLGVSVTNYARICYVQPVISAGPTLTTAFADPPTGSVVRGTVYMKKGNAI